MGYNAIHETVVSDIFETLKDGVRLAGDAINPKTVRVRNARSLARATSGLTLAFPVICTNTLPIETASMIAKAIERKNVALLQMAFSAYNITNAKDAVEHISKFHKNLNLSKMDLDRFMDTMEALGSYSESYIYQDDIKVIAEDCRRNLNYVLSDSVSESSLLGFSEINRYGSARVIKEAIQKPKRIGGNGPEDEYTDDEISQAAYDDNPNIGPKVVGKDNARWYLQQKSREDQAKAKNDIEMLNRRQDGSDSMRQQLQAMLLPSDVKKANEMQPTLMLVNFYVNDKDRDLNVAQQFVCGVKSKLYAVDSNEIINKIITKNADGDIILKLIKVSTREISFVKDFLLGIDDARLDALSKSRKGSGTKIFKALERRAINGKIRRSLRMENSAKAISTLVISSEEAEELKKYENIDVYHARTIVPIMEKLNLLYFVVVDTTAESVDIITDGETEFETYSFTNLERESSDNTYKKVVNLITKVSQ